MGYSPWGCKELDTTEQLCRKQPIYRKISYFRKIIFFRKINYFFGFAMTYILFLFKNVFL